MGKSDERPFHVLGLQQIALGAASKSELRALWVDRLGLSVTGWFRSERENVDEDIAVLGDGLARVEVDLMEPIDPAAKPAVHMRSISPCRGNARSPSSVPPGRARARCFR